jgi:hypothetical protein
MWGFESSVPSHPLVFVAHSSSGLGHRPLKAEIAGSNPACATDPGNAGVVCFAWVLARASPALRALRLPPVLIRLSALAPHLLVYRSSPASCDPHRCASSPFAPPTPRSGCPHGLLPVVPAIRHDLRGGRAPHQISLGNPLRSRRTCAILVGADGLGCSEAAVRRGATVAQRTLDPLILVRIQAPQPFGQIWNSLRYEDRWCASAQGHGHCGGCCLE